VKEVLYDIVPMNSCHFLLRWAWLHFKTLNLDERSLYLRHERYEMKFKFMTQGQASKDQHRLKKKIQKKKYKLQKEEKLKKRKGRKDKVDGKGSRERRFNRRLPMFSCICVRKRQQCCKPKIGGETLVTTKLSSESSKDQIQYRTICERSIM